MGYFAAARGDINLAVISGQVNFGGANSPAAESPVTGVEFWGEVPGEALYRGQISSKEHN
jgi:hypothetical protein